MIDYEHHNYFTKYQTEQEKTLTANQLINSDTKIKLQFHTIKKFIILCSLIYS
jgi:hypothetical protein